MVSDHESSISYSCRTQNFVSNRFPATRSGFCYTRGVSIKKIREQNKNNEHGNNKIPSVILSGYFFLCNIGEL